MLTSRTNVSIQTNSVDPNQTAPRSSLIWVHTVCYRDVLNGLADNTVDNTGPRSAVGNVSGNRCESDCRSRGREFDPGPVPYFRGDLS